MIEVDGCGRDVRVPELLRDDADLDALGAEFRGVGVAQAMGVDALLDAGLAGEAREQDADVARRERVTVAQAEDGAVRVRSDAETRPDLEPRLDHREPARVHADRPAAVAFAVEDADGSSHGVEILRVERERLGDAQAGAVEDGQQRAVPDAGPARRARLEEASDLVGAQDLGREGAFRPWRC